MSSTTRVQQKRFVGNETLLKKVSFKWVCTQSEELSSIKKTTTVLLQKKWCSSTRAPNAKSDVLNSMSTGTVAVNSMWISIKDFGLDAKTAQGKDMERNLENDVGEGIGEGSDTKFGRRSSGRFSEGFGGELGNGLGEESGKGLHKGLSEDTRDRLERSQGRLSNVESRTDLIQDRVEDVFGSRERVSSILKPRKRLGFANFLGQLIDSDVVLIFLQSTRIGILLGATAGGECYLSESGSRR